MSSNVNCKCVSCPLNQEKSYIRIQLSICHSRFGTAVKSVFYMSTLLRRALTSIVLETGIEHFFKIFHYNKNRIWIHWVSCNYVKFYPHLSQRQQPYLQRVTSFYVKISFTRKKIQNFRTHFLLNKNIKVNKSKTQQKEI